MKYYETVCRELMSMPAMGIRHREGAYRSGCAKVQTIL